MDGIDAALVDITSNRIQLLETLAHPIPSSLCNNILALASPSQSRDDIDELGQVDAKLGEHFALATRGLIDKALKNKVIGASDPIQAIGSHGQTVRHRPERKEEQSAFTLQIGDPNIIAERTNITTVADFRRRDMAAGGEGAPLAPAFHHAAFNHPDCKRVIINLGGIANITVLDGANLSLGYDTGPANGLMDAWIKHCTDKPFDEDGKWAATGQVNNTLLKRLLSHRYFSLSAPKSTGRETFSLDWLSAQLAMQSTQLAPQDVQATLLQLTAQSLTNSLANHEFDKQTELFLCGGGVHNIALVNALRAALSNHSIDTTAKLGIAPDWVEACAFAWLAYQTLNGLVGNAPLVTGAKGHRVLGAIYPGARA